MYIYFILFLFICVYTMDVQVCVCTVSAVDLKRALDSLKPELQPVVSYPM